MIVLRRLEVSGLTTRAARYTDLRSVAGLFETAHHHDHGEVGLSLEDIESGWHRPDFNLRDESMMVLSGEELVAYAETYHWRAEATVHPDHRGRGIGSWLMEWTEHARVAREWPHEEPRIGQTIIDTNTAAADLFIAHGYTARHRSWELSLPTGTAIELRPLPGAYRIRAFDPASESTRAFQVVEDAFNEWPNRTPSTFRRWKAMVLDRSDFDPRLLIVALHEGDVVGVVVGLISGDVGWVDQVAVQRDHRHLGLARALIATAFDQMLVLGANRLRLSTDSRTGALDLYLAMGMEVVRSYTHYSKRLSSS